MQQRRRAEVNQEISSQRAKQKNRWCPNTRKVCLKHRYKPTIQVKSFPCKSLSCPVCYDRRKAQYIATVKHHLGALPDEECTPIYAFEVEREQWDAAAKHLRRHHASYIRLDPTAGEGDYVCVAVGAVPSWALSRMVCKEEAIEFLTKGIQSFPRLGLRLFSTSRDWKMVEDESKKLDEWEVVGNTSISFADIDSYVQQYQVAIKVIEKKGRFFEYAGQIYDFSMCPDIMDGVITGIIMGDMEEYAAAAADKRTDQDAHDAADRETAFVLNVGE
jgi:hypothetical protein